MSAGDSGDRAILAAIGRRGQRPVREVWWQHARWFTIPGTPPEVWDEYADGFMDIFSRDGLETLAGMTEWARERLAGLN